jgi:hypothetical protein
MRFSNVSLLRALFLFLAFASVLVLLVGIISPDTIALADTGWDIDGDTGWDISGV